MATVRQAYGDHPDQYAELTRPDDDEPRGVAVLVHGGFWKPAVRHRVRPAAGPQPGRAPAGRPGRSSTAAAPAPPTPSPTSGRRSTRCRSPAATVVGIGHSAGGHLVTWAAAGGGLTHVVSQAGVLDLRAAHEAGPRRRRRRARSSATRPARADDDGRPDPDAAARRTCLVRARPRRRHRADQPVAGLRPRVRRRRAVEVDGDHFTVDRPGLRRLGADARDPRPGSCGRARARPSRSAGGRRRAHQVGVGRSRPARAPGRG